MLRNYYILNRLVCELNEILSGQRFFDCFTQEKNRIYFRIPTEEYYDRHLIVSANHNSPFIIIKNEHHRAKKNIAFFFSNCLPAKIINIEMSSTDRIVRFNTSKGSFYFMIRGHKTNLLFISQSDEIESFKKISPDESQKLLTELSNMEWLNSFNMPDFSDIDDEEPDYSFLRKRFPQLGTEVKREIAAREYKITSAAITSVLAELATGDLIVGLSRELSKVMLVPSASPFVNSFENAQKFSSVLEAINFYVVFSYRTDSQSSLHSKIEKHLDKELETYSSKLNKLRKRVDEGSKEKLYNHYGSLLLANISSIRKGSDSIIVDDYTTGEKIKIDLNEKQTPDKNVDYYFQKSKDEKINYGKPIELFESTLKKYNELKTVQEQFQNSQEIKDLKMIAEKLKIKEQKTPRKKLEDQIKYRHFLIENKYHVFIGRDNINNDLVTFKLAKQNDLWFHARGVPGSHVVLRIDNPKEPVPKNILKNVASLSAYFSKAKTAGTVPVAYTFRKFVRKSKGMPAGKVFIERETVLLVKPEIPLNCELVEE